MTALAKLDEIMEKAQEFASTWSLVGGKFDDGTLFATSQERKEELRALVRAALSPAELGGVEAAVACHRLCTGDPPSRWMWIDGPASLGAMDQARLHGWRIENAYATPRAAEAVTEYRWRSVSDDLPERTGWYIGINYGVVEPLRWDGNNWHHTRVTRDLAMPSHWRPLPAPPSAKGENSNG